MPHLVDLTTLKNTCKYRASQIDALATFIQPSANVLSPSLIVEGPSSTGKSHTVSNFLRFLEENNEIHHIEIQCEYSLTKRAVLQRILKSILKILELEQESLKESVSRCDGLGTFVEMLKQLNHESQAQEGTDAPKWGDKPFVFVLDRVERLLPNESPGELCSALSKVHEQSPEFNNFVFVYVVNRSDFLGLQTFSLATIKFTPYTVEQVRDILTNYMMEEKWLQEIGQDLESTEITIPQFKTFVKQYVDIIIDTYPSYFGADIQLIVPVLTKLWPIFYQPLLDHGKIENKVNDVLSTFFRNKSLLQSEYGLVDDLVGGEDIFNSNNKKTNKGNYDLPVKTKYIMIASYLASFNDSKYDLILFSKQRDARANRKVRHSKKNATKHTSELNSRMLQPQAFTFERLLAILRAIFDDTQELSPLVNDVELMSELATLATLKSIIKLKGGDTIGGVTKWKCNVNWSIIKKFSDDVGFEIENYIFE